MSILVRATFQRIKCTAIVLTFMLSILGCKSESTDSTTQVPLPKDSSVFAPWTEKVELANVPGEYRAEDIIEYLDMAPYAEFFDIDLEHGYFHTANSRLTLYADDTRWAIVCEKNGYGNRTSTIQIQLNYYGNCLKNLESKPLPGQYYNSHYIDLVDYEEIERIEDSPEVLTKGVDRVKLRDKTVPIPTSKEGFVKWIPGILSRKHPREVTMEDLGRFLAYEYEADCRATESELRHCIPGDLPKIMTIDQWHHKSYTYYRMENKGGKTNDGSAPSEYETYRMIAKVLETKDPSHFQPTLEPNNHWSNWPMAGGL